MATFKQSFLLVVLFVAIAVNLPWAPNKMKATALRDLPDDVAVMKGKLLPVGAIITCLKYCNVESDCSDGWICTNCVPSAFEGWRSQCDKLTASGQGYFATMLQSKASNM